MTAPANKRRLHNDAARDAARRKPDAAADRGNPARDSRYGRRLTQARQRGTGRALDDQAPATADRPTPGHDEEE